MTKQSLAVKFNPEVVPVLHKLVPGLDNPLFPFPGKDISPEDYRQELILAGFLDNNGKLQKEAGLLLKNLSQTRNSARIRVMSDGEILEFHVFLSGDKLEQSTSLRPDGKSLLIESPAPMNDFLASIADLIGNSSIASSPTLGELTKAESLVLAASIDLTRWELLSGIGRSTPWRPKSITPETLEEVLKRKNLNSSWLLWLVRNLGPVEPAATILEIEESLESLAERKFLHENEKGYTVNREALVLATRFLQLSTLVRVDVARLLDDGPIQSAFGAVQGGVRDILLIEPAGENCNWAGLSARVLLGLIERFLTKPASISPQSRLPGDSCTSCGKIIEKNDTFCKFCGAGPQKGAAEGKRSSKDAKNLNNDRPDPQKKNDEKAKICVKCRGELKSGKKFCSKCGTPSN